MLRRLFLVAGLMFILLVAACGGNDGGAVQLTWQARDGGPVRLTPKSNDTYQTDVLVRNETAHTLRDARLHLRPRNPTLGIAVTGTVTNTRRELGYDGDYWRLGDLRPGESVSFPIGLWIELNPMVKSTSGIELTIDLVSRDLEEPLTSTPLRIELP